jgi:hypothetical protein
MNTLNRLIVIALLVTATMLCCVLLAGAKWVIPALANQLHELSKSLNNAPEYQVIVIGAILAFIVDAVLVLLIIFEIRQPRINFIRVEKVAGGEVKVSVKSIVDRLKHEIDALHGVLSAKPRVSRKRDGIAVHLQADIAAGLDVPAQAEQIVETAREVIEERLGLKLARAPKVSLRTVPYPKLVKPSVAKKPPPPAKPKEFTFSGTTQEEPPTEQSEG